LDSSLDLETRDNISKSYAASRTLVHVINDLLDLTRTEKGNELHQREPFNLPATITEAVDIHAKEARRRGIAIDIVESPQGTPIILLGDHGKVGRMLSEICSNALQHTVGGGGILIEWGELIDSNLEDAENKHDSIRIGISITDTGLVDESFRCEFCLMLTCVLSDRTGMSDVQLEAMFRAFEQISTISDETVVNHSVIGLGLARVARSVRTLGGQLRFESKLGEGSRVTIVLPFRSVIKPFHASLRSH
jgi:signal transduction histidine kinase